MPERWVAIDGVLVDEERAVVSVYDRGFLYGDSVFETTRTYGGAPFRLREHLDRLAWSAARVGMQLPLELPALSAEVERLVGDVARPDREIVARLMITRGEGAFGLDPTGATSPRRVLFLHAHVGLGTEVYTAGVDVITFATYRPSDAAAGAKVGNYLESIAALRAARAAGAHEALIVDHEGHVLEGTTSNVFIVRAGVLLTPPVAKSILPGITRRLVIEAAPEVGLRVEERPLWPDDVQASDEAFITSSVRELVPVVRMDGRPIGPGVPGDKTRALHEAFRRREGLAGPPPWDARGPQAAPRP